jgi:hypothetical protein
MAATAPAQPIGLQNLGTITLQNGDDDATREWGGSVRPTLTGNPIRELQTALIALGTLTFTADGQFGAHTQEGLERFQWYIDNLRFRLKLVPGSLPASGVISAYPVAITGTPGMCSAQTAALIAEWQAGNFVATSPLVRLNTGSLSNVDTAETFDTLSYPSATKGEVLVHTDFAGALSGTMNDEAKKAGVTLRINQTFRRQGVPPTGAVVPPASRSQHLVGHAIDLNIVDGDTVNTSAMFKNGTETDNADKFIAAVKGHGLRWGGDFSTDDPPHFDDFLNPNGKDYDMNFFFAQHCFEKQHPMRQV